MNFKTDYTQEITCPWCGCEILDSWEIEPSDEDLGLQDCSNCEMKFYATRNITIDYSTKKATYGTCSKCGVENVVIESGWEYNKKFEKLCEKCKSHHRDLAIKEFMESLEGRRAGNGYSPE